MYSINIILVFFCYLIVESNCKERISGGQNVEIHEYPFAIALLTTGGQGAYLHRCGGSLITTTAILSAASCFYADDGELQPVSWWRARVGSSYSDRGGVIYLIRLITPHPSFTVASRDVDLAVLRTAQPIALQPGVVEVAFLAGGATNLAAMDPVQAIGWGATTSNEAEFSSQLNEVLIYVVPSNTCESRYQEVGFTITDNMVCAAFLDVLDRSQCQGDNGSPLLNSEGAIVGVHSWTQECAQSWYPSVNTRVYPFTKWIVSTATA